MVRLKNMQLLKLAIGEEQVLQQICPMVGGGGGDELMVRVMHSTGGAAIEGISQVVRGLHACNVCCCWWMGASGLSHLKEVAIAM
jgi:hypothetical protein